MIAMIFIIGDKYDCNDDHNGDLICLQSLPIGTEYACNVENRPRVT